VYLEILLMQLRAYSLILDTPNGREQAKKLILMIKEYKKELEEIDNVLGETNYLKLIA
jgi:hypothetical protein